MCATLNEGYLRSANRGSNNLYSFAVKIGVRDVISAFRAIV